MMFSSTIKQIAFGMMACLCLNCFGQAVQDTPPGSQSIVLSTLPAKPPAFLYSANAKSEVKVGESLVEQTIQIQVRILQGKGETISLGLGGEGEVIEVQGDSIVSWSVRKVETLRFLDLQWKENDGEKSATVRIRTPLAELPAQIELAHISPGNALGFNSQIQIQYAAEVAGRIVTAEGFSPLASKDEYDRLQTTTGGRIGLRVDRTSALPPPIEQLETSLVGVVHEDGRSIRFALRGNVRVHVPGSRLRVLSGHVAMEKLPDSPDYRLELLPTESGPVYELLFSKAGQFPVNLEFVAPIKIVGSGLGLEFTVAASAVVPVRLKGLGTDIEFVREPQAIVPVLANGEWSGFLPASGRVNLRWQKARSEVESKTFFTTTASIDAMVGPGILRQEHRITYQVLQGQLKSLTILLEGPGEILSVEGEHIVAWKVNGLENQRQLEISLNQPLSSTSPLIVRSQTPLGAFPIRVQGLRLQPQGATRSSGYLRITNSGSVNVEPIELRGLTQLAPEQFAGEAIQSRQNFVYRFPSADYGFVVQADRVQPEVSVTQLVLYQVSETDRALIADIEVDIREAPIREWSFQIPEDYSIVSVTGANVSDYSASTEAQNGYRNLKVLFGQDVEGRQLIGLRLEKNQAATAGPWVLPPLLYPEAKSIRGDLGVVAAPGFRATIGTTELLVEKPLSYFPKTIPNLQQAFRIREPGWSATMQIEPLERSTQSDVFHLYSLSHGTIYGSALVNYSVTGAPVSEWQLTVPEALGNVTVDGQGIRTWRREGDRLLISLQQPILGTYTVLITFEQKPNELDGSFEAGLVAPIGVQGDRGYVEVVSPIQVEVEPQVVSTQLLALDSLELPTEFRLLSAAPSLGTWQYTQRPFELRLKVNWFDRGTTAAQVIEFSEANSRVSPDGELVTDLLYYVKSRGQRTLKLRLPGEPVRLWAVSVNGRPATARRAGEDTLIPLPAAADPNEPMEVSLRLGKPAGDPRRVALELPTVFAPVLKTQWNIDGDENRILLPKGGTVDSDQPVLWPSGFDWLAGRGLAPLVIVVVLILLTSVFSYSTSVGAILKGFSMLAALGISLAAMMDATQQWSRPAPLQLSLPVLASGERVDVIVENVPTWQAIASWPGIAMILVGAIVLGFAWRLQSSINQWGLRSLGMVVVALGVLMQPNGGVWFFSLLILAIVFYQLLPLAFRLNQNSNRNRVVHNEKSVQGGDESSAIVTAMIFWGVSLASLWTMDSRVMADDSLVTKAQPQSTSEDIRSLKPASSMIQDWTISSREMRLTASAKIALTGRPGDRFLLLRSPAILTKFEGSGLRLSKITSSNQETVYAVTIVASVGDGSATVLDETVDSDRAKRAVEPMAYSAKFEYQVEAIQPIDGVPVLTGEAALQQIELRHDQASWEVVCDSAARIEERPLDTPAGTVEGQGKDGQTQVATSNDRLFSILLGPGPSKVILRPQVRNLTNETTQFFVEAAGVYTPGPGVIDGRYRFSIRTAQGRIQKLSLIIPVELTVSSVDGPIRAWQFDADKGRLVLDVDPTAPPNFQVMVETQRSLAELPAAVRLSTLRVEGAMGEVGLIALAFGSEAQPESVQAESLSMVNLSDFDSSLISNKQSSLHRVYRYGSEGGTLTVQVTPVSPEVRTISKQVLSLGDERIVLNVQLMAEITRTGLFQLSFPLPDGMEVESLSGESLHHWSEVTEGGRRLIVLHLKGKTIGEQTFAMALVGAAPVDANEWNLPRFEMMESTRQSGELVVQPTTGFRLRTIARQNVSEVDPRSMGSQGQGALAFRLLQRDWNLRLGIEKLEPWVTGQVLHEVVLREGQTRSTLISDFTIQNAAIRTMMIQLPINSPEEIKTVRAHGEAVNDFVKKEGDGGVWELRFKRRVIGTVQFQIEYERRGDRTSDAESLNPITFPDAKQVNYHVAIRTGGRLEVETPTLPQAWQLEDWSTVPNSLREAGNRNTPAFVLRTTEPKTPLSIRVIRHSLADSLKLRVASGILTTVLSPTGDQLTAVDVTMEVIQRSSLNIQLPTDGELFSIFVNGESVHSVRRRDRNSWQFYILPGIDDRTAQVRFVYSLTGTTLRKIELKSPQLSVPLENIEWNVIVPHGFQLIHDKGNLELVGEEGRASYDRQSYLSSLRGNRQDQAQQATQLLQQANQFLQSGEPTKAQWAFNNVANRYALDAASNEDARVQLENLQTQQAIVGLNTRRQRIFLDSSRDEASAAGNEQLRQAATVNPILQQERFQYRPQELGQLLAGNSKEDNATLQQIAGRLVQHQRTTEPAPQAMVISLPEEGTVYRFRRSVQVTENAPMALELEFHSKYLLRSWQWGLLAVLLVLLVLGIVPTFAKQSPSRS